jgi:hypothetical protein
LRVANLKYRARKTEDASQYDHDDKRPENTLANPTAP